MNCEDAKELWEKYESGTITDEEQEQLEEHIGTCAICEERLDELLAKYEKRKLPPIHDVQVPFWKIKWKHRIKMIVLTISAAVGLYLFGLALSALYYMSNDQNQLKDVEYIPKLALEAMMPNVQIPGTATSINPFFRAEMNAPLVKMMGQEEIPLGEVTVNSFFSNISIEKEWFNRTLQNELYFAHPNTKTKELDNFHETISNTWNTLHTLPEGTVAELAISFKNPYSIEEIDSILYENFGAQEIPPTPAWYALDTGYEKEDANPYLSNFNIFGFSGTTKDHGVLSTMELLTKHENIMHNVGWYNSEKLHLQKRYKYVKKHGVNVYGVVITGPSKELLKLQHAKEIRFACLGEVRLWNGLNHGEAGLLQ
ncbi:hypothetical protein BAMA_17035 [Bacillus manliponensis]|uniref:Sigma-M negative effector n=1 Tax=Bacillus manliponensis TaxID=574376 RepID=A0A073KCW7_9BACI|nr:anti-sigma factor [Bacillus manliponensis]KEK20153.1 hypothetical protein BAMA_17035 [Bacillus manliponensis]